MNLAKFSPLRRQAGTRRSSWLALLLLTFLPTALPAVEEGPRGGLSFSLANAELLNVGEDQFFCFDVLAASPDPDQRLGTGIVLLNYNPQVFGVNVAGGGNAVVTAGTLITTTPFPFYNLIINDNSPTRLAVTWEYLFTSGLGSPLPQTPQQLLNIRLRLQERGLYSGLSFQPDLMQGQQYLDDNATLFAPVNCGPDLDLMVPATPANVALSESGGELQLSWDAQPGCAYRVYACEDPAARNWQLAAEGLTTAAWTCAATAAAKFYRVTAVGLAGPATRSEQ